MTHPDPTAFIDGELDEAESEAFRSHLRDCQECRDRVLNGMALSARLSNLHEVVTEIVNDDSLPSGEVRRRLAAALGDNRRG